MGAPIREFYKLAALACLIAKAPLACRKVGSEDSVLRDEVTPPSAEVMAGFTKCVGCHAAFKDPATGKASWPKLVAKANLVAPRIDPDVADGTEMPPEDAAPNQQIDLDLKRKMHAAIKQHVTGSTPISNPTDLPLDRVQMPPGFKISVYAIAKGARSLALSPSGTLFIGSGGFAHPETKVYAARDLNGDRYAEDVKIVLDGMNNPNGVALKDGALYVAERYRVLKYRDIESHLDNPGTPTVVWTQANIQFSNHSWKYIAFGPDGKLYVPVGAPCNACDPDNDPQFGGAGTFARIFRMSPGGQNVEVVARGVRNTVGFDWHPTTQELWFTDNGRDGLGDGTPPDELNRVAAPGEFFGFPNCHGKGFKDPTYGPQSGCATFPFRKPEVELGAHVAALGMKFYTGSMFPTEYRNRAFVAEHGSWNSTVKVGAKISMSKQGPNGVWVAEPFASGWVIPEQDTFWGRPVDLVVAPDGALLVSDDKAGVVYRITYEAP